MTPGKSSKVGAGRPTVLTPAEEREIVISCQVLQELGYGLTREIVTEVIHHFLNDQGRPLPFKDGHPGPDWWEAFMGRWPTLSERKPQHLSAKRATASNPETLKSWFDTVQQFIRKVGLLKRTTTVVDYTSRLWNSDETGFCLGATSKNILAKRGDRSIHEIGGASDHQFITVNVCGNAAGVRLPPFILYKGKNLYTTWTEGGPAGAYYGVSQSGWMEEVNYLKWFEKQFYPAVRHLLGTGPVVLLFDGHFSHMSIHLIKKALSLGIHLFCLPPNTTHVLQPLDVGVFGPMKQCWRTILKRYKISIRAANISKERFPQLISDLWKKSLTPEHLKAGFRCVGLAPFNPSVFRLGQTGPSLHASAQTSETPDRTELRSYFCEILKPAAGCQKTQKRRRIELSCTGDILTSDEVLEKIEKADALRAAKKKKGKQSQRCTSSRRAQTSKSTSEGAGEDDVSCEGCGQPYRVDEADSWIGCDNCESWWHYWCAGLHSMLSAQDEWMCDNCMHVSPPLHIKFYLKRHCYTHNNVEGNSISKTAAKHCTF